MDNKYEIINEEIIDKNTLLYTAINISTKEQYLCVIDNLDSPICLVDDNANKYDIAEAIFQYDLDLFPIIPKDMITPNMYREYQDYYPGKGDCIFKTDEDYEKAYQLEEERVNKQKRPVKHLVK